MKLFIVGKESAKVIEDRELLINGYCHLVNKSLLFVQKYFEGVVPAGRPDEQICHRTKEIYDQLEEWIGVDYQSHEAEIYELLMQYLVFANEYFEKANPWKILEADRASCRRAVLNTVQMVANLTVWLKTIEENCAFPVAQWLSLDSQWHPHSVHSGYQLPQTEELVLQQIKNTFQMA